MIIMMKVFSLFKRNLIQEVYYKKRILVVLPQKLGEKGKKKEKRVIPREGNQRCKKKRGKKKVFSGAHSRVATLIRTKFFKETVMIRGEKQ